MLQAITFPKTFSDSEIYHYLKQHNHKPLKGIHNTLHWKRVRISEPLKHKRYFTKILPNNIHYIYYL
jgi:hypothetical protein